MKKTPPSQGFAHESPMGRYAVEQGQPWPGILESVPSYFNDFINEPAFSIPETSFCVWRMSSDNSWVIGDLLFPSNGDPDGSADLLFMLDGNPHTYHEWCTKYYERSVRIDLIEAVYRHATLTNEIVGGLNPKLNLVDLANDISEIDYPIR